MKPMLSPIVAPSAGESGSAPAAWATDMTTGTIMFADAVLDVTSESAAAMTVEPTSSAVSPVDGIHARRERPIASASPAWNDRTTSPQPPPYSSTNTQPIPAADRPQPAPDPSN